MREGRAGARPDVSAPRPASAVPSRSLGGSSGIGLANPGTCGAHPRQGTVRRLAARSGLHCVPRSCECLVCRGRRCKVRMQKTSTGKVSAADVEQSAGKERVCKAHRAGARRCLPLPWNQVPPPPSRGSRRPLPSAWRRAQVLPNARVFQKPVTSPRTLPRRRPCLRPEPFSRRVSDGSGRGERPRGEG